MLISETVEITWNAKIKKHYVDAGYMFTKMKDKFLCDVNDLTTGSNVNVSVQCDYCGAVYEIEYYRYLDGQKSEIKLDCCNKCKKNKIKAVLMKKYGVATPSQIESVQDKIRQTNIKIYGVENPFSSTVVKKKIVETNLKRYGCPSANQAKEIQEKRKRTCIEKYGEDSHMKTQIYREMFSGKNNPHWKTNKSDENRERDRSCSEYVDWRNSVFRRDHYRCQCCGGRGDRKHGVEAHHIENYASHPELRFLVENGITLCHQCHKNFHSTYGRNNNNLSQLTQFLNQGKKVC